MGNILKKIALLLFCLQLVSCRVHQRVDFQKPPVSIPKKFQNVEKEEVGPRETKWWEEFGITELNNVVEKVLQNNLDLKQSWWQVIIQCQIARQVSSNKWPQINTAPGFSHFKISGGAFSSSFLGGGFPTTSQTGTATTTAPDITFNEYLLSNSLSYEVDLWRRIDSLSCSACLETQATNQDLEAAALIVSGTAVDLWFTIQEQKTLLDVINHQIKVSKTQLELIELRFGLGISTALDIYQQRLQLKGTISQKPKIEALLKTSQNQLNILMAKSPDNTDLTISDGLIDLPPMPFLGEPIDLLCTRPDLRAQHIRLQAKDYEVAAAIADMFPRLDLSLAYDYQAEHLRDLFEEKIAQIISQLTMPLIDGGRRRAVVKQKKAEVCQLIAGYGQQFLTALGEIEDSLVNEKHQIDLIAQIKDEIEIAKSNLEESRWHYINGLNDYLTVIAAIQSLQELERSLVIEKKNLLVMRSKLLRALGLT